MPYFSLFAFVNSNEMCLHRNFKRIQTISVYTRICIMILTQRYLNKYFAAFLFEFA